jgi:hypothetical protein
MDATFERLIRIFVSTSAPDVDDFEQWVACVDHFPRLGQRFLDRVFELVAREPELSHSVVYFVTRFSERDDRIESLLDDLADRDPQGIALLLTSYADASRLPVMLRTFGKVVRDPRLFLTVLDLAHAIEALGGIIPESSKPAIARAMMASECHWALLCAPACPCGSGVAVGECACGFSRRVVS